MVVDMWEIGKFVIEAAAIIGAISTILIRSGYHRREHKAYAEAFSKLQNEHDARLLGCPPVEELKETLHELAEKQDQMDHKIDTILGFLQGQGLKVLV